MTWNDTFGLSKDFLSSVDTQRVIFKAKAKNIFSGSLYNKIETSLCPLTCECKRINDGKSVFICTPLGNLRKHQGFQNEP